MAANIATFYCKPSPFLLLTAQPIANTNNNWAIPADEYRVRFQDQVVPAAASSGVFEGVPDHMRSSPVRRTFCLIVVFDVAFSVLLYLIYLKVAGYDSLEIAFTEELLHYQFMTSLFDTVVVSLWRFIVLEFAYGLCKMETPWTIAVTTLTSCVIVIVKCCFYQFHQKTSPALDYGLLILMFVLPWVETVFLEYRVLPQERAARQVLGAATETTRLLQPGGSAVDTRSFYSAVSEGFFSPPTSIYDVESMAGGRSEAGGGSRRASIAAPINVDPGAMRARLWQNQARHVLIQARRVLADEMNWTVEGVTPLNVAAGDPQTIDVQVCRKDLPGIGRVFRLRCDIPLLPSQVIQEYTENCSAMPEWNPTIVAMTRVARLDECMDIVHNVAAEALGGTVASRDFVLLRIWESLANGSIIIASRSIDDFPEEELKQAQHNLVTNHTSASGASGGSSKSGVTKSIRAASGIGVIFVEPLQNPTSWCRYTWIMHSDLKGWLPRRLTDQAMSSVMTDFVRHLLLRAATLKQLPEPHTAQDSTVAVHVSSASVSPVGTGTEANTTPRSNGKPMSCLSPPLSSQLETPHSTSFSESEFLSDDGRPEDLPSANTLRTNSRPTSSVNRTPSNGTSNNFFSDGGEEDTQSHLTVFHSDLGEPDEEGGALGVSTTTR